MVILRWGETQAANGFLVRSATLENECGRTLYDVSLNMNGKAVASLDGKARATLKPKQVAEVISDSSTGPLTLTYRWEPDGPAYSDAYIIERNR
jgi:hypothetical protein